MVSLWCLIKTLTFVAKCSQFKEELKEIILNDDGTIDAPIIEPATAVPGLILEPLYFTPELNISQVYEAIMLGIKDYFSKMGFYKAIIGSSGGIDSAVTIALACEALGKENVRAILMPSEYSSSHSLDDAEQLSKNLDNPYDIIPIKKIYQLFLNELKPVFNNLPFDVAEENIQARQEEIY